MKRILFVLGLFISLNASAQLGYPTSVFWQFLEGYQAGDSSTQKYLEYKNGFLLLETNQRDAKVLQVRNELNDIGISTLFIDANGNGGLSIDSAGGQTVIKLRGSLNDHSYINNTHVSIGRGGQTQDYGGNVDGAKFTVSDGDRNPLDSLGFADYYQAMIQSSSDVNGQGAGLAFTNENAAKDINVGASIVYEKLGNNGYGALNFYAKNVTTDLLSPNRYMRFANDSTYLDATNLQLPNLSGSGGYLAIDGSGNITKTTISTDNIYTADGTLTGDRTLNLDTYDLTFNGGSSGIYELSWDGVTLGINNSQGIFSTGGLQLRGALGLYKSYSDGTFTFFGSNNIPLIRRSVADANPSLIVLQNDASSTGDIAQFHNSTGAVAVFDNEGKLGIGTTSPSYKLDVSGSINHAGASYIVPATTSGASGATTVLTGATFDNATLIKASHDGVSTGNYTLELPAASSSTNRTIRIISDSSTDSNHKVVIVPTSGDTLDGGTSGFTINRNYEGLMVWSDGTEWFVIQSKNI